LHAIAGHDAAPGTKKAVNSGRPVVVKPFCVFFKQRFVALRNADAAPVNIQVGIAPQSTPLAFGKRKAIEPDAQHHHAARLIAPFPKVAAEHQIRPVTPPVFAKQVEYPRIERLHGHVFLNVLWVKCNVVKVTGRLPVHVKRTGDWVSQLKTA
jgi:hypothetical protein